MKYTLILIFFLFFFSGFTQLTYETVWVDYDSAWTYKSLQVVPVRYKGNGQGSGSGKIISLSKALEQGLASVSERGTAATENVHWLRINNHSDQSIFVASGQTFVGGRQDRMVSRDTILPASSKDQYISVMCIEELRWSEKEKKLVYNNYANAKLRRVLDRSKNQLLVWKEIYGQLQNSGSHSTTFAYNALRQNKTYQLNEREYLNYFIDKLKHDSSAVGIICVSDDKVIGTDIFAYRSMFRDELEPLLYGYINEALLHGGEPVLTNTKIKEYADKVLTNETVQEEYCSKNGKIFRADNKVIHVTAY